jgi:CRP-like cAMP-binding protein
MSENEPTLLPGTKPDDMFPILDPAQQARLADQGTVRQVKPDETLVEAGARNNRFFVVLTGELNILRVSEDREEVVAVVASGAFTGEISMLSGRRGLVRVRRRTERSHRNRSGATALTHSNRQRVERHFPASLHPAKVGVDNAASAVGEGSMAVSFVHRVLAE